MEIQQKNNLEWINKLLEIKKEKETKKSLSQDTKDCVNQEGLQDDQNKNDI